MGTVLATKIVYVLVSGDTDFYSEQLTISVFSLRKHNPDASVVVLTDKLTNDGLLGNRRIFVDYITELKVVETPDDFTQTMRSRYLKTKLRELIEGDFLYIDVDTVICGSLSEIDSFPFEMAACSGAGWGKSYRYKSEYSYHIAEKVGWELLLENEPYFNGGVIYAKDTVAVHSLYKEWYKQYLICVSKQVFTDQTALCMANMIHNHFIHELDNKWNFRVQHTYGMAMSKALIIHYYYVFRSCDYCLSRDSVFLTVRQYGINIPLISDLMDNPRLFFVPSESLYFLHRYDILRKWSSSDSRLPKTIIKVLSFAGHLLVRK